MAYSRNNLMEDFKVFNIQEVFGTVLTISSPFALWTGVTNGHKNVSTGIEHKTSCVVTTLIAEQDVLREQDGNFS